MRMNSTPRIVARLRESLRWPSGRRGGAAVAPKASGTISPATRAGGAPVISLGCGVTLDARAINPIYVFAAGLAVLIPVWLLFLNK
jgi:hypothetical protein